MDEPNIDETATQDPDRLDAVVLRDWEALGGPVEVHLSPHRTVFVGKNGTGKSLLLEAIDIGAMAATYDCTIAGLGPHNICYCFARGGRPLRYAVTWSDPVIEDGKTGPDLNGLVWSERCWYEDNSAEVWSVNDGVASLLGGTRMPIPLSTSLLKISSNPHFVMPEEASWVRQMLAGITIVHAGVPRTHPIRSRVHFMKPKTGSSGGSERFTRIEALVTPLLVWHEKNNHLFDRFEEICRRVGILSKVHIQAEKAVAGDDPVDVVSFDDINIGLLSDGTLRIAEIIKSLVDPKIRLLLIEEPETAIHPGLLRKLLEEIKAHTHDKQVLLTTHSPLVVDWARYAEIRLVERTQNRTTVRGLTDEETAQVVEYLNNDDGTLAEFVYDGGLN